MPAYSKEKTKEIEEKVKRCLVINPHSTCREIGEELGYDYKFINRLTNRIRKERAKRFNNYTIDKVLAGFQDEVEELKKNLWVIINSGEGDRVAAIKELRNSSKDLIDKMFDAGFFERNLGKLKNEQELKEEDKELLEKAIKYAGTIKEDNRKPAIQEGTGD